MAKSNFRVFAEGVAPANIQSDNEYETDTQRISGVVPGIAVPALHNKLYKQATIMAAAMAQVIVQAGLDAMDDDYTGLVANLRKTFVGSVNGIKPNAQGNIDLTSVLENIRRMTYPRIGDVIMTKNPENPSVKYTGTTWELLEEKTFIMSAGNTSKVGEKGGSNTHVSTVSEMPSHTHGYTMGEAGGHDHDRGNMNITGFVGAMGGQGDNIAAWDEEGNARPSGAFYPGGTFRAGRKDGRNTQSVYFDASRNWTGRTSYVAAHNHSLSINATGSGQAWDSRPKYIALYIWIRTE
nr:MAG TPA: baseplate protein [Caudoviricetes sp.]